MPIKAGLPPRLIFAQRLGRNALLSSGLVSFSLGIGALGYHELVGLDWLDATLNASMILTGMGPLAPFTTTSAKLFGIFYSLFSGVAFLSFAAVLLSPVAHRFLHRFQLEVYEEDSREPK
jgi:hypothetical protein